MTFKYEKIATFAELLENSKPIQEKPKNDFRNQEIQILQPLSEQTTKVESVVMQQQNIVETKLNANTIKALGKDAIVYFSDIQTHQTLKKQLSIVKDEKGNTVIVEMETPLTKVQQTLKTEKKVELQEKGLVTTLKQAKDKVLELIPALKSFQILPFIGNWFKPSTYNVKITETVTNTFDTLNSSQSNLDIATILPQKKKKNIYQPAA